MSETIVFFGSGPVAADSLRLLSRDFLVEAVITKPRPPHHHGVVPVLEAASSLNLPVHTAQDAISLQAVFANQSFSSRVGILIDFGIIVPQSIIDYFPLGIVNSHFSLLPEWRGADPITFAILSGQDQTGVSLMLLVKRMDEGPLLAQQVYKIDRDVTTPTLTKALLKINYELVLKTLPAYMNGAIKPYPQSESIKPTYSRRLAKEDGIINWQKSAVSIERQIRALYGWPQSRAMLAGKDVIITVAHVAGYEFHGPGDVVGQIFPTPDGLIGVATGEGVLVIDRLKPSGKPEMSTQAFLAGYGKLLSNN